MSALPGRWLGLLGTKAEAGTERVGRPLLQRVHPRGTEHFNHQYLQTNGAMEDRAHARHIDTLRSTLRQLRTLFTSQRIAAPHCALGSKARNIGSTACALQKNVHLEKQ